MANFRGTIRSDTAKAGHSALGGKELTVTADSWRGGVTVHLRMVNKRPYATVSITHELDPVFEGFVDVEGGTLTQSEEAGEV